MLIYVLWHKDTDDITISNAFRSVWDSGNTPCDLVEYDEGVHKLDARLSLLARCDAVLVVSDLAGDFTAIFDLQYAQSLGIPVYYGEDELKRHEVELSCPNQVQRFLELQGKMFRTHLSKNADYSPANILGTGEVGLVTRMWDKTARLMNLTGFKIKISEAHFTEPQAPKNESKLDTVMDLAVYSVIYLVQHDGKWGN
jgi:hypothetical protein